MFNYAGYTDLSSSIRAAGGPCENEDIPPARAIKKARLHGGLYILAEREGFEPSVHLSTHTRLAGERLQPARPSLRMFEIVAEGVGFEPTELSLNGFQDRRLKPLGHPSHRDFPSIIIIMQGQCFCLFAQGQKPC